MTDTPRPAPQYGEYATPEEQQEIIRRSGGPQGAVPAGDAQVLPVAVPPPSVASTPAPEAAAAAANPRRRDRFVTIALLAYGLFTVVTTIPQLIDYAAFAELWMRMAGIDADFTAVAEGRAWGTTAAVLFAVGWIVTALLSWRAIVRGRLSWWIALVGAVVSFIVVSICLSVPLMSDPAVIEGVLRSG
ncbi:DUF6264 family protein [Microbacterium sp. T2.11-28]|uniref:DUF6264 family protein n=1 Tax=Microbacterium sp. T2.11-28 TaxID=3041169 RepID=UPI0024776B17|nr:DUF6264 family protein [Microbacterium sp. T2.11-28]CAI9386753.1 hypothetical protein MICABA_00572 [Microbacterium sp. T2.11-28]